MEESENSAAAGLKRATLYKRLFLFVVAPLFLCLLALYFWLDMQFNSLLILALALPQAINAQTQYTSTAASAVAAARATALTLSPVSSVKGKTFDRFVTIWCENTDFDMAAGDRMSSSLQ